MFNLAMGATSMPRMNVITSLVCRNFLSETLIPSEKLESRHNMVPHTTPMEALAHSNASSAVIIGDHNPQCSIVEVESATAIITLYGNLIAGVLGAVAAPLWGKVSDRFGRIKPLAAASTVLLGSELVMIIIAKLPDVLSVNWILLTYFLEGLRCVSWLYACFSVDLAAVGLSFLSWRSHQHMLPIAPATAKGMLLLAGSMGACSLD